MAMTINVVGDFTLGLTFGIAGIAASTLVVGAVRGGGEYLAARSAS